MSCVQAEQQRKKQHGEIRRQNQNHHDASLAVNTTTTKESIGGVLVIIFLVPCRFVMHVLSSIAQISVDLVNNTAFFLYVVKNLLNELFFPQKCATSVLVQSSSALQGRAAGVPDAPCSLPSAASKNAASVVRDREWFLSDESFPEATRAEQTRFLKARNGDVAAACVMLKNYLDWKSQFDDIIDEKPSNAFITDEDPDWSQACRMASSVCSSMSPLPVVPPCILFMPDKKDGDIAQYSLRTVDGKRVLQHLPARIDLSVADAQVYATALSLYIDRCVSRDSMEKICVVIDTRPGDGWANIPATKLIPFIKHAAKLLNDLHPERLSRCILFPVPSVAKLLWNAVKPWLDEETADKICIVSGSANIKSPVPKEMNTYFRTGVVEWMEQKRLSSFVDGSTKRKLEAKLAAASARK